MLRSCLLFGKVNLLRAYMDPLFSWISLPSGSVQGTESGSLWYTVGACYLLCANVKVLVAPWGPALCSPVDSVHSPSVPGSPLLPQLLPFPLWHLCFSSLHLCLYASCLCKDILGISVVFLGGAAGRREGNIGEGRSATPHQSSVFRFLLCDFRLV